MKSRILIVLLGLQLVGFCQDTLLLDKIIAVVGNNIILESEIRSQIEELKKQEDSIPANAPCILLEQLLVQKLILAQSFRDSVEVTETEIENELDRRLKFFISRAGGDVSAFENFYGKNIEGFKEDYRDDIKSLLLVQKMTNKITGDLDVTPTEVTAYYYGLHKDSIPFINEELEIGEIMKKPRINPEMREYARQKAEEIYRDAKAGKDFNVLVKAYSCDPGSNGKNGTNTFYSNIGRNTFVPEFEQYAFKLAPGEISPVFETSFGFHVLKVLAKKGEFVDVAHVLTCIETSAQDMEDSKEFLDSLRIMINRDSISFIEAASRFSDEEDSKVNGGTLYNPFTGNFKFEMEQVGQYDPTIFLVIEKLLPKELSLPVIVNTREGKQAYRILYIKSRTKAHVANLRDDYQKLKEDALAAKEERIMRVWVNKKLGNTHVWVADDYKSCKFESAWVR